MIQVNNDDPIEEEQDLWIHTEVKTKGRRQQMQKKPTFSSEPSDAEG